MLFVSILADWNWFWRLYCKQFILILWHYLFLAIFTFVCILICLVFNFLFFNDMLFCLRQSPDSLFLPLTLAAFLSFQNFLFFHLSWLLSNKKGVFLDSYCFCFFILQRRQGLSFRSLISALIFLSSLYPSWFVCSLLESFRHDRQ